MRDSRKYFYIRAQAVCLPSRKLFPHSAIFAMQFSKNMTPSNRTEKLRECKCAYSAVYRVFLAVAGFFLVVLTGCYQSTDHKNLVGNWKSSRDLYTFERRGVVFLTPLFYVQPAQTAQTNQDHNPPAPVARAGTRIKGRYTLVRRTLQLFYQGTKEHPEPVEETLHIQELTDRRMVLLLPDNPIGVTYTKENP